MKVVPKFDTDEFSGCDWLPCGDCWAKQASAGMRMKRKRKPGELFNGPSSVSQHSMSKLIRRSQEEESLSVRPPEP